ncbi:MAG: transcriptional repressor [Clostridia bacterium]|nr:transcriptional repressor [Clostridia bacterium]
MTYRTNNRARIMDFLEKNKDKAVSVVDIEKHLDSQDNHVNVTTIYRYLDKLEEAGELIKVASTYQLVDRDHRCDEHLHLKCKKCGKLIHLDCGFMDEISSHVLQDHGFTISCDDSIISGLCKDCSL